MKTEPSVPTPKLFIVVDDDPTFVAFVTKVLESQGHAVKGYANAGDALAEAPALAPDGLIIDIMLPGMDGLSLISRLRKEAQLATTRFIVCSAKSYESDRRRAKNAGADAYIQKPVTADGLLDGLEKVFSDAIEITFWGVRGTLPTSGPDCLKYGGDTSCVSLDFSNGQSFIFDAGTGIKELGDQLMAGRQRLSGKIFISHPHWDHINALPFFAPLFVPGNDYEVLGANHGDISMRQLISAQMDGLYFPITPKEFGADVYYRNLAEETLEINGIQVQTMLLSHPGNCLGYRVSFRGRTVCYVTDNELFLPSSKDYNAHYVDRLIRFVSGADVLITDSTYTDQEYKSKVGWGHSCLSQVVDLAHRGEVKHLYLFHHDPNQKDADIDAKLETAQEMLADLGSETVCHAPAQGSHLVI